MILRSYEVKRCVRCGQRKQRHHLLCRSCWEAVHWSMSYGKGVAVMEIPEIEDRDREAVIAWLNAGHVLEEIADLKILRTVDSSEKVEKDPSRNAQDRTQDLG